MGETFLTADLHIGHEKIIYHCRRPFENKAEHDEIIIKNYNDTVGKDDHVYILGDITYKQHEHLIERLNGWKHIILGNHDVAKNYYGMMSDPKYKIICVKDVHFLKYRMVDEEGKSFKRHVWLSHYPHRSWKNSYHGSYHAFGHCHGTMPNHGRSMDVGVDCHDFKPIHVEDFFNKLKDQPYGDGMKEFAGLQK